MKSVSLKSIDFIFVDFILYSIFSKQMNMETPFYGRIAENENFTNRRNETEFLKKTLKG